MIGSVRSGSLPGAVARWVELHTTLYSQTLRAAQNIGSDITRAGLLRDAIASGNVSPQLQKLIADSIGIDPESIQQRLENPRTDAPANFVEDSSYSLGHPEGRPLPQKGQPVSAQKKDIPKTSDRLDSSLVDDPVKYPPHEHAKIVESWLHAQGVITDPDGETVLMPNPDQGTVAERAWHLIASKEKGDPNNPGPRYYNDAKAASVFSIPQTITDYQVKGVSPDGTQIGYFRKYGGILHMVLVNKASGRRRHHGLSTHRQDTSEGGIKNIKVDKVRTALNEEPYTPEPAKELPDWTGPVRTTEEDSIPGTPDLTDDQLKETEDRAYEHIQQSRVLDVDAVLPHIPGYNEAHPLTRDRAYRRTARDITRKLLDRLLAEPKKTGKVIIVSGGAGSGKSDVASKLTTDTDLLIETALSAPEQIYALRDQIASSGRDISILHIHRDFSSSFEDAIYRYLNNKNQGSSTTTDLSTAVSTYLETADTLSKIEKVSFRILDNNRSREERRPISLENLAKSLNTQIHETAGDTGKPGRSGSMAGRNGGKGHPRPERRSGDTETKGSNPSNPRGAGPAARLEAIGLEIIEGFRTSGRLTNAE
ncbi:MAG: hypothetical protein EOP84_15400, partial [Verrucomicrobiaceae bacterium]